MPLPLPAHAADAVTMVRLWNRQAAPTPVEFETQQQKLARMSEDVLRKYRADLDVEVHDPARLNATYGAAFMKAESAKQAEVVATMATSLLNVPNAMVNVILPDRQMTVAWIRNGENAGTTSSSRTESFCQHVIQTGREFSVEDSRDHPLVCDTKWASEGTIVSYLGVPIANKDAIIVGVLCVYDDTERYWTPADVSILTQLSLVLTRTTAT